MPTEDRTLLALSASLIAGLSTGIGALPLLVIRRPSARTTAILLGFGAGVMLAASAFTLLGSAFEAYADLSTGAAMLRITLAVLAGALFVQIADATLPHEHFEKGREGPRSDFVRGAWLFVIAIGLHNFPEGLAVGVGFGGEDVSVGYTIAAGIVIQNLPEGLIAAASLRAVGLQLWPAIGIAALTGLVETIGGVIGWWASQAAAPLVPLSMAFAAGAMLYVIGQEVIPESHAKGRERFATWGLLVGFLLMTGLDRLL